MNSGGFTSKLKPEKVNQRISSTAHFFEGVKVTHIEKVRMLFSHETERSVERWANPNIFRNLWKTDAADSYTPRHHWAIWGACLILNESHYGDRRSGSDNFKTSQSLELVRSILCPSKEEPSTRADRLPHGCRPSAFCRIPSCSTKSNYSPQNPTTLASLKLQKVEACIKVPFQHLRIH